MPHVERMFTMMDRDGDGVVTKEDFYRYCITNNSVRQSMGFLP
jgi:Ca2+-binding EF-hand superfamily protein